MANGGGWGRWEFAGSEPGPDLNIFTARYDTFIHPVTGVPLRATILETAPWVKVVARVRGGGLVMVRQFRFGARDVTLEVPAGLVDEGEEPQHAAARELLEETGYASETWSDLGPIYQNPASHTNLCHLWLADDATPTGATSPGAGEHIQALVMSEAEVVVAVRDGRIAHPLTLAALSRVLDLRV
jgi:8-oxo-dGTP pyrophosphatase MutT (NUDIX family)